MAHTPNSVETHVVKISTTPWAVKTLDDLASTGRFGKNAAAVAEELLRAKLREIEKEGWLERSGSDGRASGETTMQPCRNGASIDLTPQSLVGVICAHARVDRLPPRAWPVEVALDLVDRASDGSDLVLKRAVARWPRGRCGVADRYAGLDKVLRELARAGHLVRTGEGWHAAYEPRQAWLMTHRRVLSLLSEEDRNLLGRAAQALRAALSTWSKKAVASAPVGEEAI